MFNCNIRYNDTNVNIKFPCTNLTLFAKIADLHVPDDVQEGDIIELYIDKKATEEKKNSVKSKMNKLFRD